MIRLAQPQPDFTITHDTRRQCRQQINHITAVASIQHIACIGQICRGLGGIGQRCLINPGFGADTDMQLDLIADQRIDCGCTELHFFNCFTFCDSQRPGPGKMHQEDVILNQVMHKICPFQAAIL